MTQQNTLELAKQVNLQAIAALINRSLQPKGIKAKTSFKDGCLLIFVQAEKVPEPQDLVDFIFKGLMKLQSKSIEKVKLCGQKTGEDNVDWCHEFELAVHPATTSNRISFNHLQNSNENQ